jgi:hypothetical protein
MINRNRTLGVIKEVAVLLLGAIIAAVMLGPIAGQPAAAEDRPAGLERGAAAAPSQPGLPGADNTTQIEPSAATWISCTPIGVATYIKSGRVHVQCAAAVNGIRFFAVSTSDAANAARVLSTITTAQVAGRTLTILYDPADLSGASIGCQTNDCRLILAVGFGQ